MEGFVNKRLLLISCCEEVVDLHNFEAENERYCHHEVVT